MPFHVCNGAMLKCLFAVPPGTAPLTVLPINRMLTSNKPAANIMDFVPMMNIPSFGACISPMNPAFVAATTAAFGVPTPVPCMPATTSPWIPGAVAPPVLLANQPALDNISMLMCALGGPAPAISIIMPGEVTEMIP